MNILPFDFDEPLIPTVCPDCGGMVEYSHTIGNTSVSDCYLCNSCGWNRWVVMGQRITTPVKYQKNSAMLPFDRIESDNVRIVTHKGNP
jgi:hypothetical protein